MPPGSPANSSTKSSLDSMPIERLTTADTAAARLFQSETTLPSLRLDNPSTPDQYVGRTGLTTAFLLRLDRLEPDPGQPRRFFDASAMEELVNSVRTQGVLQPILVRYVPDAKIYRIVSGERRYQASKAAGLEAIPCILQNASDKEILIHQVTENWVRADLHPFEVADSLVALRDRWNLSQAEISRMIGKSAGDVSKFLALTEMPADAQALCRNDRTGRLTRSHMEAVVRAPAADQRAIVERVSEGGLTVNETRKLVTESVRRGSGMKPQGAPVGAVFRYKTQRAQVLITFRRAAVTTADLLDAVADVQRQIAGKSGLETK